MNEQQKAIVQFVQGLAQALKVSPEEVAKAAQQNPKALESAITKFQETQDINQAAATFAEALQTPKAKHGAKLNYLKTLKHQCPEGEELYYYKRGGSVDCGCKKKEDGGEINKAQKGTAVDKFKKSRKKEINPNDTVQYRGKAYDITAKESPEKSNPKNIGPTGYQRLSKQQWGEMGKTKEGMAARERVEEKDEKTGRKEQGGKLKKDCGGGFVKRFKAAKCGTKMKKHQLGGSLNGIPFIRKVLEKKA